MRLSFLSSAVKSFVAERGTSSAAMLEHNKKISAALFDDTQRPTLLAGLTETPREWSFTADSGAETTLSGLLTPRQVAEQAGTAGPTPWGTVPPSVRTADLAKSEPEANFTVVSLATTFAGTNEITGVLHPGGGQVTIETNRDGVARSGVYRAQISRDELMGLLKIT